MGAWGSGNFENDTALDFRAEVEGADDPALLLERIDMIAELPEDEYVDADLCCELLVAAEYVAAALGKPARDLERAEGGAPWGWEPTPAEVAQCVTAVRRVAIDSELSELWAASEEWANVIDDLLVRLGQAGL